LSYAELTPPGIEPDELGNPWVELESMLPVDPGSGGGSTATSAPRMMPYFCLPSNDKLMAYWDTISDRLFKIRHCMDLEGQLRPLPLFEPPIDPGLLVRARAAGIDLRSALRRSSEVPPYRYTVMHQKALEFCGEVRSLGTAVLSALEKRDAESLGLLRSTHELNLLTEMTEIRTQQVNEAIENLEALKAAKATAEVRKEFYSSQEEINAGEGTALGLEGLGAVLTGIGSGFAATSALAHLVPQIHAQGTASGAESGGEQFAGFAGKTAENFRLLAGIASFGAHMVSTVSAYHRRKEEWDLQADLSDHEMKQIDRQIAAAEIRLAIAEKELSNHRQQIAQTQEMDTFLRGKFSNQQLYDWQAGQLSALHFQAYQLALDLAFRAQNAANWELGQMPDSPDLIQVISMQHSDTRYRRLTAGEELAHELRKLDAAYLKKNSRRYEVTKHVSLAMLDPAQLIALRETGACQINIPELVFDLDFPQHCNRRLKAVRLTIPCVAGPYTSVSATLTLLNSRVRMPGSPPTSGSWEGTDIVSFAGTPAIATSSGQSDSGMFELNFRDERFLPFEGAGAISDWRLELSGKWPVSGETLDLAPFDFDTISDVILHLSYTAQDGGELFKGATLERIAQFDAWLPNHLQRLFSLRQDFPDVFHRLLNPAGSAADPESFEIDDSRFPFFVAGKTLNLNGNSTVYVKFKDESSASSISLELGINGTSITTWGAMPGGTTAGSKLRAASLPLSGDPRRRWTVALTSPDVLDRSKIEDIMLLLNYVVSAS
jgi:Tc toxin complex TcA C-terminal TcB-binding domain